MRHKIQKLTSFCIVISISLLVASCTSPLKTSTVALPGEEEQANPVVEYQVSSSRIIFDSYETLMKVTNLVLIGVVEAEDGVIIHNARNPYDHSLPAEDIYSICTVYRVRVKQIYYGKIGDELLLCHGGGILPAEAVKGDTPSESEIRQVIADNTGKNYVPLEMERRYLMFLRSGDPLGYPVDGYISNQINHPAGNPWLFNLVDEKAIQVIDISESVGNQFPPRSLEETIEIILGGEPYPSP